MKDEIFQVQLANPDRDYVKVYKDFLASPLLTVEEKMVYIALKSFVTYGHDTGEVFPSMDTLCKLASLSRPRATRTITSLIKRGIVTKVRRGLTKSNLYTLVDIPSMWKAETVEQMQQLSEDKIQLSNEEMIEELQRRGAIRILKEKELESESAKTQKQALNESHLDIVDNSVNLSKSQGFERYSLEEIRGHYNYEIMIRDNPYQKSDIESVVNILHTTLNTTKPTVRICGEDMPTLVVTGKLMNLTYMDIMYAIEKYHEKTDRIYNPIAYMLTLLYVSVEQKNYDVANQVRHDMANWKKDQP